MPATSAPASLLAEFQAIVARLYTDEAMRSAFIANPAAFVAACDPVTAQALIGLDLERLAHFSQSLLWKRAKEARRFIPLTARALGDRYGAAFLEHARRSTPSGTRKPLADAMAFARSRARDGSDVRARDAARFEWLALNRSFRLIRSSNRAGTTECRCELRRGLFLRARIFQFDLPAADPDVPPTEWRARRTLALFVGGGGRLDLWYW